MSEQTIPYSSFTSFGTAPSLFIFGVEINMQYRSKITNKVRDDNNQIDVEGILRA